ncbi:MAG TPA: AbrB/MazE/SpoVT family DNA-binding domain-containing protein [Actinomycetota bacterium]|nr:AbrB/MazE/SpoVT family DNA-binding domain-containing protein [Actinomycetota bacterium]
MAAAKVGTSGEVTIPTEIREAAHLEAGDSLEVEIVPEGILLRPLKGDDPSQSWFWRPEWQQGEREASADVAAGRVEVHESDDDFLASLDESTDR